MKRCLYLVLFLLTYGPALAKVKVVTTIADLADLARAVGGEKVEVTNIVRGSQNPHSIEVKPSYMLMLKSADIFLVVGLQLELWAPQIIDGSRNNRLLVVDCSKNIEKLEVPAGPVDARHGDVHPFGNPHYWLDPENAKILLGDIYDALVSVSPGDREYFTTRLDAYRANLDGRIAEWKRILAPFKGGAFVSYHTSFAYFARRFGLTIAGYIEPKPGIPPTPSHSAELIQMMRSRGVTVIGLEQCYEGNVPERIAEATGATVLRLTTSVGGVEGTGDYISMIDHNVRRLAEAFGRR